MGTFKWRYLCVSVFAFSTLFMWSVPIIAMQEGDNSSQPSHVSSDGSRKEEKGKSKEAEGLEELPEEEKVLLLKRTLGDMSDGSVLNVLVSVLNTRPDLVSKVVEQCTIVSNNIDSDLVEEDSYKLDVGCENNALKEVAELRPNLTKLSLGQCRKITDAGLTYVSNLGRLTELDLSGCKHITDNGVRLLSKLKNLKVLKLSFTQVTGTGLEALKDLTLTILYLDGCDKIDNRALQHLQAMPLEVLSLSLCKKIMDIGLETLPESLTELYLGLGLSTAQRSGAQSIGNTKFLSRLINLTVLDLSGTGIMDNDLQHLPKGLTKLNLSKGISKTNITDGGLAYLMEVPLTELNLSGCPGITGTGFKHLPKTICELNLYNCTGVGEISGLEEMPLTFLDVTGCKIHPRSLKGFSNLQELALVLPRPEFDGRNVLKGDEITKYLNRFN